MRPIKIFILLLFGLIQFIAAAKAQESFMRHYTIANGLPSNTIYRMEQDADGYIWIGSEFGVSRFNGKTFDNYSMADGLSDNEVIYIKKDSKGRVWFLGYNGTVSYWLKDKFFNEQNDTMLKQIKTTYCFINLFEDKSGRIWFMSIANSIILNGNEIIKPTSKEVPPTSFIVNGYNREVILSIKPKFHNILEKEKFKPIDLKYQKRNGCGSVELPDRTTIFSAKEGLISQFDTLQLLLLKYPDEIANSRYISLAYTQDSIIWIAAQFGLYSYDYRRSKKLEKKYNSNSVLCNMLIDQDENIWISTLDDGIYMWPRLSRNQIVINHTNGLQDNNCYTIFKTEESKILIGMHKNQLAELNPITKVVNNISPKPFNPEKIDFVLSEGIHTWIIANNHILHRNKETKTDHLLHFRNDINFFNRTNSIKGITFNKNKLYLTTNYEIYEYAIDSISINKCKLDKQNKVGHFTCFAKLVIGNLNRSNSIFLDQNQTLWYGTADGIFYYKNGKHQRYTYNLPYNRINAIWYTSDSLLIVGTHGFGLFIYKNSKLLYNITQESGLANNLCRKIVVRGSKIYVATPSGLSIITLNNQKPSSLLNLNKSNLLPSDVVNDLYVDNKEIGVATSNGVIIIGHETIKKLEEPHPKLNLTVIQSPNGLWKFKFTGIYYLSPDAVNYRYRLKQNQEWNTTTTNELEFPFLGSGDYTFEVQARVYQGKWTNSKFHSFVIYPPFWQKWWFIGLIGMIASALIVFLIHKRINHLQLRQAEKLRVKQQLIDLEQQALLTMMNPHFIFNVMNSIQHFINQNNAYLANQYLSDFAKLIRMNLSVSIKKYISLDEEIEYLNLYLSFEKLRFGEQLNYQIIIDPSIDTDETTVAVMMIQPFLENAIWHGILPMQSAGEITVKINRHSEQLIQVCITDNGVGIPDAFLESNFDNILEKSHGLNLTFKRLRLLCEAINQEPVISFSHLNSSQDRKGTVVIFLLPNR